MTDLIYFEMKRIYKKRSTWVILGVMLIGMIFLVQMFYRDHLPSQSRVIGTGSIDETVLNQVIDAKKSLVNEESHYANGKIEDIFYIEFYDKYREVDNLLSSVLSEGFYTEDHVVEKADQITTEGFYERWVEKQREILETDYSYGNYSESEIQFFMNKIKKTDMPFIYSGNNGWEVAIHLIPILGLIIGCLNCLMIAPIVSYDYQNKVDLLILSSKYGRKKSARAKNRVVLWVTMVNSLIFYGIFTLVMGILYGIRGYKDSTVVWLLSTPYNLINLEAYVYVLAIALLGILVLAQMSLLVSMFNKWVYTSMAISFAIAIFPKFIQHSRDSRLLNDLVDLLPIHLMDGYSSIGAYKSYDIFGVILLQGTVKIIISVVLISVLMMINRYVYTRRTLKQ